MTSIAALAVVCFVFMSTATVSAYPDLVASGSTASSGCPLSRSDVALATSRPRDFYKGQTIEQMDVKLNKMLRVNQHNKHPPVRACEDHSVEELRLVVDTLLGMRHEGLASIYKENDDPRTLPPSFASHAAHAKAAALDTAALELDASVLPVVKATLCRTAVLLWVHHLGETRQEAMRGNITLPMLPERTFTHVEAKVVATEPALEAVHTRHAQASGCASCHWSPPATPLHASLLKGVGPPSDCKGSPEGCPLWPTEFSAPFTLHATLPPISGAKSTFYYKYLEDGTQATLVDYEESCFPFVDAGAFFNHKPCKLYFDQTGIHLSQPARGIDCCLFKADVGAVPPAFLKAYTRTAVNVTAPDMYGNDVMCEKWEGPEGFKYWTVGHFDKTYSNWGHDIVFQDGPTGVTWRWGNFNVTAQSDDLFKLPSSAANCSKSCSAFL